MSYTATHPGESITVEWLHSELQRISSEMNKLTVLELEVLHIEPERAENGTLAFADGTNWNPGSGAGTYERRGGAWVKL